MCTSLFRLRLSANVHTTAKRAILNQTDDSSLDLLCNFSRTFFCPTPCSESLFVNGHAQIKTFSQARSYETFSKHVSTKHFQLNLLSDWRNTICMKQSISQSPHFLCPIKEEDIVQWGFYLPGCQMDLDWKPWQLCDWHLLPANHEWRLCDLRDWKTYHGGVPGHLYNSW